MISLQERLEEAEGGAESQVSNFHFSFIIVFILLTGLFSPLETVLPD